MSDAEATIRHSILSGYTEDYPNKSTEKMIDNIIKAVFEPCVIWSVKEYLSEIGDNHEKGNQVSTKTVTKVSGNDVVNP